MNEYPKALQYANALEASDKAPELINVNLRAAAELRRLHEVNQELLEALKEMSVEFRALDLPYGSKAYTKAIAAIAKAERAQT